MDDYLNIKEQIKYLKSKNMQFTKISEKKALDILSHETYYHKVISYKNFFSQYTNIDQIEDFHNLEFQDLYELYQIDEQLKEILNDICLEVESFFKVFLVRYAETLPHKTSHYYYYEVFDIEKRYKINHKMEKRVRDFNDGYSKKMLKKFPKEKPIWVLNEFLSFGEVIEIFSKYCKTHNVQKYDFLINMLMLSKTLRNTTVHGNKLFSLYTKKDLDPYDLKNGFEKLFGFELNDKYLNDYFKYNVIATMYCYKKLVPDHVYKKKCDYLYMCLHKMIKSNEIFKGYSNEKIVTDIIKLYKLVNRIY